MAGRKPTISDEDILRFIGESSDPAYGTTEIAEHFEFSQGGMHKRLVALREEGFLASKTTGGTRIWWITKEGKSYIVHEARTNDNEDK